MTITGRKMNTGRVIAVQVAGRPCEVDRTRLVIFKLSFYIKFLGNSMVNTAGIYIRGLKNYHPNRYGRAFSHECSSVLLPTE